MRHRMAIHEDALSSEESPFGPRMLSFFNRDTTRNGMKIQTPGPGRNPAFPRHQLTHRVPPKVLIGAAQNGVTE